MATMGSRLDAYRTQNGQSENGSTYSGTNRTGNKYSSPAEARRTKSTGTTDSLSKHSSKIIPMTPFGMGMSKLPTIQEPAMNERRITARPPKSQTIGDQRRA